jgi:hypothetical protein
LYAQPRSWHSTTPFPNLRVSTPQCSVRATCRAHRPPPSYAIDSLGCELDFVCGGTAISTDSEFSHHAWAQQPRAAGGLGPNLVIPLLADRNMSVARDYGCLIEDKGITFRASYLIDPKGQLRQITINDLPVGRSVDEARRVVEAFQFAVSFFLKLFYFILSIFFWCDYSVYYVLLITDDDNRMSMGKSVRPIGRRVAKQFVRILRPSWSTLRPLLAAVNSSKGNG